MLFSLLQDPVNLIGFLLAIIIGLTVHEFAHAWTAFKLGDYTAKYAGRLSLNPSKHFDTMGTLFLLLVGFGWGKPVPVNPNALKSKYDEFKIAVAGPLSNIIVAFIFSIPVLVSYSLGIEYMSNSILLVMKIIIEINLILAAFNIIPLYPLDGSRILRSLAPYSWQEQILRLERSGPLLLFGLIFLEYTLHINILFPVIIGIERLFSYTISFAITSAIDFVIFIISLF